MIRHNGQHGLLEGRQDGRQIGQHGRLEWNEEIPTKWPARQDGR